MAERRPKTIIRDISWLSFNARVLQEANDPTVPLQERIRFLGIFSNNLDEFFRIRVATLKRMIEFGRSARMHLEQNPARILEEIQRIVISQQLEFSRIWKEINAQLRKSGIFLHTEKQLNREQRQFVSTYFTEEVRSHIIPLMLESIQVFPNLRDKSIYLAVVLSRKDGSMKQKFALVEIPTMVLPRFILLPSPPEERHVILMEDIVRFNLPYLFSFFGYDRFSAHIIKVTRDAELDIDNDVSTSLIQKIVKGLKDRKRGKPVRFIYDRHIDPYLLEYLIRSMNLSGKDNLIPGDRIHNFKDFMDFPERVFQVKRHGRKSFIHPRLEHSPSITRVIQEEDILLQFPYHSFDSIIDLLREAAIDPNVTTIKITAYRLARNSKIINALINAARNGKHVLVVLELRARFDEEANLEWKIRLEEEGAKVLIGVPNMKVHAKVCVIKKRINTHFIQYGFVSTGNLNEGTATYYADHCLLTANRHIMADINRIFAFLETGGKDKRHLEGCRTLLVSPVNLRKAFLHLIDREIRHARKKKPASMTIKMNSLSDTLLIGKLYEAAREGVQINLIIRGVCCALTSNRKWKKEIRAVSIIDEYLEHARVLLFHNNGKELMYISSSDWMVRNLDHRVEAATPVFSEQIRLEIKRVLNIQLQDNVKSRILDNEQRNVYNRTRGKRIRSQIATYNLLHHPKPVP